MPTHRIADKSASGLIQGGLPLICGVVGASIVIGIVMAGQMFVVGVVGALAAATAFTLSGNPRLTFLWGLLLTAPLAISKNFVLYPHMGGAGAYSIDVSDPFLLALTFFLIRDRQAGYRDRLHFPSAGIWWGLMIVLGISSGVFGQFHHIPLQESLRMAKCLLLMVVIANELARVRLFLHAIAALAISFLVQGGLALVQFVANRDLGLQFLGEATAETIRLASEGTYRTGESVFRVSGLLGHPNLLSASLALCLPVMAGIIMSNASMRLKLLCTASLLTGSIALMLTLSRSGWLAFAIAFVMLQGLILLNPGLRSRNAALRIAVIAAAGVMVVIFSPEIVKRFTASDAGALNFRYEWMEVAWNMVKQYPVFGTGLNSFVYNLPGNTQYGGVTGLNERFGEVWPVVHNIYLLTWAEQGTVGMIFFVAMHVALIRTAVRNLRNFHNEAIFLINAGALSGLIAVMFDGIGSFYLRNAPCGRLFFIVAGIIYAVDYWNRANGRVLLPAPARQIPPQRLKPA